MIARLASIAPLCLCLGACVTGTAHRLPITGNPMEAQARACETKCREHLRPGPSRPCLNARGSPTGAQCGGPSDSAGYARCLDDCPGATAIDGASCPEPPAPGVVCAKTYKANPGGIAGGVVAAGAIGLTIVVIAGVAALLGGLVAILAVH